MSKYDASWRTALHDAKFRDALLDALRKASDGNVSTIAVPPSIAALGGDRSGTVVVRSGSLIRPKSQLMVHSESLGKQMVEDGMLADWPRSVFRLSIDGTGKRLTVRLERRRTPILAIVTIVTVVVVAVAVVSYVTSVVATRNRADGRVHALADCLDQVVANIEARGDGLRLVRFRVAECEGQELRNGLPHGGIATIQAGDDGRDLVVRVLEVLERLDSAYDRLRVRATVEDQLAARAYMEQR